MLKSIAPRVPVLAFVLCAALAVPAAARTPHKTRPSQAKQQTSKPNTVQEQNGSRDRYAAFPPRRCAALISGREQCTRDAIEPTNYCTLHQKRTRRNLRR